MNAKIFVTTYFLHCKINADFVKRGGGAGLQRVFTEIFQASSISGIKVGVTGLVTGVRCYRLIHFLQGTSAFQVLWKVESCCQLGTLRERKKKKGGGKGKRRTQTKNTLPKFICKESGGGKPRKPCRTNQFVKKVV